MLGLYLGTKWQNITLPIYLIIIIRLGADRIGNFQPDRTGPDQDKKNPVSRTGPDRIRISVKIGFFCKVQGGRV